VNIFLAIRNSTVASGIGDTREENKRKRKKGKKKEVPTAVHIPSKSLLHALFGTDERKKEERGRGERWGFAHYRIAFQLSTTAGVSSRTRQSKGGGRKKEKKKKKGNFPLE